MNFIKISLVALSCIFTIPAKGQELNISLCKEFLEADKLYLIKSNVTTKKFTTLNGDDFTFEEVVKTTWSEKEVIPISEAAYSRLPNHKKEFHILLANMTRTKINSASTLGNYNYDGIQIKKGSVKKLVKSKYLYFMTVNMTEVNRDIFTDRLIFATQNLRDILKNYKKKNYRSRYYYKIEDYKEYLKTHTLYLKKSELYSNKLNTISEIKKHYPYKFKIVTDEEWETAVLGQKENIAYLEHLGSSSSQEVDVMTTSGKLLITSFGWIPPIRLSKRNFRILFKD